MYFPKYFKLYEFVPAAFFPKSETLSDNVRAFWLFDDRILRVADLLRERYGKLVCNDWYWRSGSDWGITLSVQGNQYRGWRPPNCLVGSITSQHRWGRALDLTPLECTVEEIRVDIIARSKSSCWNPFSFITAIEMKVPWLHIDCRNGNQKSLHLIYP